MQRREHKIGLRDRKRHRRPKERDLAVMIGVGRQTINRLLKSLEQDGIVTTSYTALTIQNVEALERLRRPLARSKSRGLGGLDGINACLRLR
jgi:DNA-binding transcriptional regulator YhcF (GntR family)